MEATKSPDVLLFSPREFAPMLGVSPRKLWGMTFEDKPGLPHVRFGRLVRYNPAEVLKFLDTYSGKREEGDGK